jgi:hypothetical protein
MEEVHRGFQIPDAFAVVYLSTFKDIILHCQAASSVPLIVPALTVACQYTNVNLMTTPLALA